MLTPRDLQRPRPQESLEEALWPARGLTGYRNLAFRRDGKRVFILRTVFCDGFGAKKKAIIARCFCPERITPETPEFLPKAPVRNNSPPCGPGSKVAGGGGLGWVGLGWVVAGWLAGWLAWCMVHDGKTFGFDYILL